MARFSLEGVAFIIQRKYSCGVLSGNFQRPPIISHHTQLPYQRWLLRLDSAEHLSTISVVTRCNNMAEELHCDVPGGRTRTGPLGSPQLKRTTAKKYVMALCRNSVRKFWKVPGNICSSSSPSSSHCQRERSSALLFVKLSFRWARALLTEFPRTIILFMKISGCKEGKWFAQGHSAGRQQQHKMGAAQLKAPALTRRWHCQLFCLRLASFLCNRAARPGVPVRPLHAKHHPMIRAGRSFAC